MANADFDRVVILVDMDCFYCQVEEQLNPNLKDKPIAVVQYNAWRGGGIIAVNYPARDKGVTRHMRGDDAKEHCPDIQLVKVPQVRGKADLTKYRDAGKKVAEVLQTFTTLLERASVDEAYLDVTEIVQQRIDEFKDGFHKNKVPNTFVVGSSIEDFLHNIFEDRHFATRDIRLAIGAVIAEELRAEVLNKTGYKCSAGIAHNKILAKLVCGLHKPNKQTILPDSAIAKLYETLPVRKIRSLGGKLGNTVSEVLGIQYMGELSKFSQKELIQKFDEKTGHWLYNIARGIDTEPVTTRLVSKSIGCCKKFPGRTALCSAEDVEHWIKELSLEISERLSKDLEENNRKAKQMVVSFSQEVKGQDVSSSRTHPLASYECKKIAQNMLDIIRRFCMHADGSYHVKFLGLSVGSFEEIKKVKVITSFFKVKDNNMQPLNEQVKSSYKKDLHPGPSSSILSFLNMNSKPPANNGSLNVDTETIEKICTNSIDGGNSSITSYHEHTSPADNDYDSDCSIWSSKTVELNINSEDLIFYENCQPTTNGQHEVSYQSETSNIFEENDISNQSEDSISNEIRFSNSSYTPQLNNQETTDSPSFFKQYFSTKGEEKPERSFFQKYFDNLANEKNYVSVDRQFDTSKKLESQESDDSLEDSSEIMTMKTVNRNFESNDQLNNVDSKDESREICIYCTKSVSKEDLQSHMDYHYALEIVKQESNLYRIQPTSSNQTKLISKTSKKKKRVNGNAADTNTLTIRKFFHKDLSLGESQICDECNKRIKLEEILSHQDYHVAKKLHLDLNSCKLTGPTVRNKSQNGQKVKNGKKNLQSTTLSSFLKPL